MKDWKLTKRGEMVRNVAIATLVISTIWVLFVGTWFALGGV